MRGSQPKPHVWRTLATAAIPSRRTRVTQLSGYRSPGAKALNIRARPFASTRTGRLRAGGSATAWRPVGGSAGSLASGWAAARQFRTIFIRWVCSNSNTEFCFCRGMRGGTPARPLRAGASDATADEWKMKASGGCAPAGAIAAQIATDRSWPSQAPARTGESRPWVAMHGACGRARFLVRDVEGRGGWICAQGWLEQARQPW
jgi:hypothetical protein